MPTHYERELRGDMPAPSGDLKVERKERVPAPSALSGALIGSFGGAAVAGPLGALAGLVLGAAAGQLLEHLFPSRVESPETPKS